MTQADFSGAFLQEARELLESLEQALLDLEQTPHNGDLIDQAFRALHTVKGSGSMFGFEQVANSPMLSNPRSITCERDGRGLRATSS